MGSLISEVSAELDANQINYEIQYENTDEYAAGTVLAQSIAEGIVISEKSAVSKLILTVAAPTESSVLSDYAGMPFNDAYRALTNLGYVVSIRSMPSDEFEENTVIRTEPEQGTTMNPGDSVCIIYATTPTSSTIPDLRGKTLEEARTILNEAGLVIGQIDGSSEVLQLAENQQFIMSSTPAFGTQVPRRSSIKLIVGSSEDVANGGTPTPTPVMWDVTITMEGVGQVSGAGSYAPGTVVTLQATPAADYVFAYWRDGLNNIVGYNPDFSFVVGNANATYCAVFERGATPTPTPTPPPTNTPVPTPTPEDLPPEPGGEGWVDPIV